MTGVGTKNLLNEARAAMGGLGDVDAAIERVKAGLTDTRLQRMDHDTALDEALSTVLAGGDVPNLGEEYVARVRRFEVMQASAARYEELLARLQEYRREYQVTHVDDGLAYLAAILNPLMREIRGHLDHLTGVDDAQTVIDRGVVEHWAAIQPLASTYAELRQAQRLLVTHAINPAVIAGAQTNIVKREAESLCDLWGTVKNYAELYPERGWWEHVPDEERAFGKAAPRTHGNGIEIPPPEWMVGDQLHRLRILTSPDHEVWLPSLEEMRESQSEHFKERRAAEVAETKATPLKKATDTHLAWDQLKPVVNRPTIPAGIDVP